jgi:ABC-2 type transport system permease protein
MIKQMMAIAGRVIQQIIHDHRFLVLSIVAPTLIIYILFVFFNSVNRPFFDKKAFVPPVGAYMVHFLTYVLSAIVLVRERTAHTLTRMFVSGYQRGSIIGGYVIAYSIIATLQSLVVLIELNYLFDLKYDLATFFSIYIVIWLLAIISIALGIFFSNFARNEGHVLPTVPLVLIPSVFFSGMIVSVDVLPKWAGYFAYFTPMYYTTNAIRGIANGLDMGMILSLVIYGAIVMILAVLTLREQN